MNQKFNYVGLIEKTVVFCFFNLLATDENSPTDDKCNEYKTT